MEADRRGESAVGCRDGRDEPGRVRRAVQGIDVEGVPVHVAKADVDPGDWQELLKMLPETPKPEK